MLELIYHYNSKQLQGIPLQRLRDILIRTNGDNSAKIMVEKVSPGIIFLSNKKIIKCIHNYYDTESAIKLNLNEHNRALSCSKIHQAFNITSSIFDCKECHIQCIRKVLDNKLKIKHT